MDDLICGYTWGDIQRAQQGGRLGSPVHHTEPQGATDADKALLAEHGAQGLRDQQFHGTIDRLQRSGLM